MVIGVINKIVIIIVLTIFIATIFINHLYYHKFFR